MVHPIPVEKMISVKREYAKDLASKRIENIPSLGSRCKFGGGDMINLNGSFAVKTAEGNELTLNFENEKVWVLPLEHSGLLKWRKNDAYYRREAKSWQKYCRRHRRVQKT